jgi:hypothetical protein
MLSALLILMTGFVGGVAITVALGVGLYIMVMRDEEETNANDWTPPSPRAPPPPQIPSATDYGGVPQRPALSPSWPRSASVDFDDWRY